MELKVQLTEEEADLLVNVLRDHWDCGPKGSGWQSPTLQALNKKIDDALEDIQDRSAFGNLEKRVHNAELMLLGLSYAVRNILPPLRYQEVEDKRGEWFTSSKPLGAFDTREFK